MRKHITNITQYSEFKYRIKEKMDRLPYRDYLLAKQGLPRLLGIHSRTFERYLYTHLEDTYEMPADQLAALAHFFDCKMEDLLNYDPKPITLAGIGKHEQKELALSLGLTK